MKADLSDIDLASLAAILRSGEPFALLDANYYQSDISHLFIEPETILSIDSDGDARTLMAELEQGLDAGLYAAGYLGYEAAHQFDPHLPAALAPTPQTVGFGLFRQHIMLTGTQTEELMQRVASGHDYRLLMDGQSRDFDSYLSDLERLQGHIKAGDTYQTNYTFRLTGQMQGDPFALYDALRAEQPVSFGAMLAFPNMPMMLSRSPELFFRKTGDQIVTMPMKGTAPRGDTSDADEAIVAALLADEKTRSENTIIVDLLRNDFGRVAAVNSVSVEAYLSAERYKSVHQLTSTISATVKEGLSLFELIAGIFPCGSVTGAPKRRTMQIIQDLEACPRGVYTGSIGYILPNRDICMNVAIRTLVLDADGAVEMGVGGGIVHESDGAAEYTECHDKARFLRRVAHRSGADKKAGVA